MLTPTLTLLEHGECHKSTCKCMHACVYMEDVCVYTTSTVATYEDVFLTLSIIEQDTRSNYSLLPPSLDHSSCHAQFCIHVDSVYRLRDATSAQAKIPLCSGESTRMAGLICNSSQV
jgi:hypothetical protein